MYDAVKKEFQFMMDQGICRPSKSPWSSPLHVVTKAQAAFDLWANGLIEEFHHPLKAALKAYSTDQWSAALPTLLLGFRSVFKEDLQATTAELVYGKSLRLPGEFFDPTPVDASPKQLVEDLKHHFATMRPVPTSCHGQRTIFVHPHLNECSHVFVRHDGVHKPLQAPYDGPYKVLVRRQKTFDLEIKGASHTISIDRLKPAFIIPPECSSIPPAKQEASSTTKCTKTLPVETSIVVTARQTTRSGRQVRPPRCYVHFQ
ncbi:uncharacterized protein LOC129971888 [Argiope bruennichi]|uniref:uncharacterized protein LOC129971888 n=1 Tax=Argiope bruennichi TaxID=94029 RepID=UPI0024950413|nr:uncharacterized protein LOC129971888 [Argiope bruennichi]